MCGHIFTRLSRYNDMFSDINIRNILEQIFNELNIINATGLDKNEKFNFIKLELPDSNSSCRLNFNSDRIYISYLTSNVVKEYELTSSGDFHKREYLFVDNLYLFKETFRKFDYINLSDNKKSLTQLRVNSYIVSDNENTPFTNIESFKNIFDNYIIYNPDKIVNHHLIFNAITKLDEEHVYTSINFKYDDIYLNTKNYQTDLDRLFNEYLESVIVSDNDFLKKITKSRE